MKKILFGMMMAALAACSDETTLSPDARSGGDGNEVTLTVSVSVPDAGTVRARSLTSPAIEQLWLVVFDANGYLMKSCKATPVTDFTVSTTNETKFNVTLTQTSEKRIIHFVANCDASNLSFGKEDEVIGGLTVSGEQDAYWQRVELPSGIDENTFTDKPVPLLRNYVRIEVKVDDAVTNIFELTGVAVVNEPTQGYVAPYSHGSFPEFLNADRTCKTYENILSIPYAGSTPQTDTELKTTWPDNPTGDCELTFYPKDASDGTCTTYLYERSNESTKTPTYILVKGKYGNETTETYYRIDLVRTDKETGEKTTYNLLRNFHYVVTIKGVNKSGKATAKEAADALADNDINVSTELADKLNISDGTARLDVSFIEKYIVATTTTSTTVELKYKYVSDIKNGTTDNGSVKFVNQTGDVVATWTPATTDDADGWRTVTITSNTATSDLKYQKVTVVGGELQRVVKLHLMKAYKMTVECPESVARKLDQPVTVKVTIPADLKEAIFPLTFLLESSTLSLYPDASQNSLPVKVNENSQSFGYEKTLELKDYQALTTTTDENGKEWKTFTCYFKTNKKASACTVTVSNDYFTPGSDSFTNPEETTPTTLTIPAGNLIINSNYYTGQTVTIYTDANCTNSIGTCTFTKSGNTYISEELTLKYSDIGDYTTLYFAYTYSSYGSYNLTMKASVTIENLEKAAEGTKYTFSNFSYNY